MQSKKCCNGCRWESIASSKCSSCARIDWVDHYEQAESGSSTECVLIKDIIAWYDEETVRGEGKNAVDHLLDDINLKIVPTTDIYDYVDIEISKLLNEYSSTPLEERKNGWDWLIKLRTRYQALMKGVSK